jgi:mono/diheme cytochrome c family protein
MKQLSLTTAGLLALMTTVSHAQSAREDSFEQIERGRYLSVLGDCSACHTAPGTAPFSGGVVLKTPFGNLVGPNITPDAETGIGRMTEDEFQKVMSDGIGRGGYHLYGAMPFTAFTKVSKADNSAIYAYLQSLQPVENAIEPNQLPFPFSVRTSLIVWNYLNFQKGEFKADPAKSQEWNRGAYIVEGLGHCGTCHTPKTALGGDKNDQFLEGATLQDWHAPNITADLHKGIGSWSKDDLVAYLKTGTNRFDTASGPMAEEVEHSSQHWTGEDLKAVATYLKDGPDVDGKAPTPIPASDNRMTAGREIYADRCSACHMPNGEGVSRLFPKLSTAPLVNANDPASLVRVVLAGSKADGTQAAPTGPAMPSFAWNLSDENVADVLTFVRNSWGNAAPAVKGSDVEALRTRLQE